MLLYYITDRKQLAGGDVAALLQQIELVAKCGIDFIQLREKDLSASELEPLARDAMDRIRRTKTKLLINSRTDVALAVGAHGVHLRSDDVSVAVARSICEQAGTPKMHIGVSCHTIEEVARAHKNCADYMILAPIFGKNDQPGVGLLPLRMACALASVKPSVPVFALGGITTANAVECIENGAAGVAGIRLFQSTKIDQTIDSLKSFTH